MICSFSVVRGGVSPWHDLCFNEGSRSSRIDLAEEGRVVGLEIRIDIAPGKRAEFLQAADSLIQEHPARDERCLEWGIFEQHGIPNQFLWHEEWADRASLDDRMASGDFRTLLGALRVLGRTHEIRIANVESVSPDEPASAAAP
jgi:quinol monooxygenase YgiN